MKIKNLNFKIISIISIISLFISNIYMYNKYKEMKHDKITYEQIAEKMSDNIYQFSNIIKDYRKQINMLNMKLEKINNDNFNMYMDNLKKYIRLASYIENFNKKNKMMIAYYIIYYSHKYNIPVEYLVSVIYTESRFIPNAISDKGCIGLTQINYDKWGERLIRENIINNKSDLFKIKNNIEAGAYILRYYYDLTGNWKYAFYRYFGISPYGQIYKHKVYNKAVEIKYTILN